MGPRRQEAARLPFVLFLLAITSLLVGPATSQQDSPFEGQGLDPTMSGFIDGIQVPDGLLPVYLSVILQKLVEVDEINYKFHAIFSVALAWRDSRVASQVNAIVTDASDRFRQSAQKLDACDWAASSFEEALNNPVPAADVVTTGQDAVLPGSQHAAAMATATATVTATGAAAAAGQVHAQAALKHQLGAAAAAAVAAATGARGGRGRGTGTGKQRPHHRNGRKLLEAAREESDGSMGVSTGVAGVGGGDRVGVTTGVAGAGNSTRRVLAASSNLDKLHDRAIKWCQDALQAATPPECKRPCLAGDSQLWGCCDMIYLPALEFFNVVGYSQDRYATETLIVNGDFVIRVVRVQGEFSTLFNFKRFPFDSQELQAVVQVKPASWYNAYIVPSFFSRDGQFQRLGGKGSATFESSDVTGWTTISGSLTCEVDTSSEVDASKTTVWQEVDARDPLKNLIAYDTGYIDTAPAPSPKIYSPTPTPSPSPSPSPSPTPSPSPSPPSPSPTTSPLAAPALSPAIYGDFTPQSYPQTCTISIQVARVSNHYVWTDIFPVILTVVLAFSVFFADPTDLDVRLATVITLFLALVALQFTIIDQIPKTTYLTAFGILVIMSYFVLAAIVLEVLFVYYLTELNDPAEYEACSTQEDSRHAGKSAAHEAEKAGAIADAKAAKKGDIGEVKAGAGNAPESQNTENTGADATAAAGPPGGEGADRKDENEEENDIGPTGVEVGADGIQSGCKAAAGGVERSPLALISAPFRALGGAIKGGFKRAVSAVPEHHKKIKQDKSAAYRFAAHVDNVIGALLFIGYIVAMAVILAVYS